MLDLIATQALVERAQADAQKEVSRYKARIDNAPTLARDELGKEYLPQIEGLQADITTITQERDQAHARIEKLGVAVSLGIPLKNAATFAELLQGSNPDEYEAHAEHLLELFRKAGR
ncbi:hypothetical protein C8D87_104187 [Lentzea atacamensis]|uniref:Uncharacterized protein n=1 Tax=Lentzea atacamensis TaxID=531938 RepID=A0ABX9E881_9PSEU|nr:hypothetical protein [Lentzea atacamensis]RAS65637.1 hypothetical protein C8D87_104187 [Lentzea atacamensis]